jgi:RNA polymerase-binding transcription factor DksA
MMLFVTPTFQALDDLENYKRALEAKRAELVQDRLKKEEIMIERVPDATDELVLANQRDLAVDTLNREAAVARQVAEALERIPGSYGFSQALLAFGRG